MVTYSFLAGMPIMAAAGLASFFFAYAVDKLMLLRLHTRPPFSGTALIRSFVELLPIAVILHVALASWIVGSVAVMGDDFGAAGQGRRMLATAAAAAAPTASVEATLAALATPLNGPAATVTVQSVLATFALGALHLLSGRGLGSALAAAGGKLEARHAASHAPVVGGKTGAAASTPLSRRLPGSGPLAVGACACTAKCLPPRDWLTRADWGLEEFWCTVDEGLCLGAAYTDTLGYYATVGGCCSVACGQRPSGRHERRACARTNAACRD
jgi:hypothetical protein